MDRDRQTSPSLEQIQAILLGAAVGDAFGVPFEFLTADDVAQYPLDRMHGCDGDIRIKSRWGLTIPAGAWSDDTSMIVATMESLIRTGGWDGGASPESTERLLADVMEQFLRWWNDGEYCAIDRPFGLGKTVMFALGRFEDGTPALESGGTRERDNGNGSLMRIFPVLLNILGAGADPRLVCERGAELICAASRITHAHAISQLSCLYFCAFLRFIIAGESIEQAHKKTARIPFHSFRPRDPQWQHAVEAHARVMSPGFASSKRSDLTASGYVVDTLEIVLYSLLHSRSYRETIQTAVSFGGDTDTYAAIAGAAAGAFYGREGIPGEWLSALKRRAYLEELCVRFHQISHAA